MMTLNVSNKYINGITLKCLHFWATAVVLIVSAICRLYILDEYCICNFQTRVTFPCSPVASRVSFVGLRRIIRGCRHCAACRYFGACPLPCNGLYTIRCWVVLYLHQKHWYYTPCLFIMFLYPQHVKCSDCNKREDLQLPSMIAKITSLHSGNDINLRVMALIY